MTMQNKAARRSAGHTLTGPSDRSSDIRRARIDMSVDQPIVPVSGGRPKRISAIPMWYHGVKFRSTLEADWAATFDALGWYWEYEPIALNLGPGLDYLCDFRLPHQRVWCEVKGPHNVRIEKPQALSKVTDDLVVILRPGGPGGIANWQAVDNEYITINYCCACAQWSFITPADGYWKCRRCRTNDVDVCMQYVPAETYLEDMERFRQADGWPWGNQMTHGGRDLGLSGKLLLQRARDMAPWTRS